MSQARQSKSRKKRPRYGAAAGRAVARAVHLLKRGDLKSGPGGKGGTVKSRRQAIAIGLSEARARGAKVPKPPARRGRATKRRATHSAHKGAR